MNPERWRQIEQVYYSVVASTETDRSSLLDALCSDNPEVRREVESLLKAQERAGDFLTPAYLQNHVSGIDPELFLIDRTFGPYQVVSAIGAGAMGDVYLARDTRLGRQVALKVLPPQFTRDEGRVARFQREAKAASALNHPNIMSIYEIGEIGETWFIAAEFIEGATIRERLTAGAIDTREAVEIAIQCAVALNAAHRAGILHRDLKPENIMIRPDGLVKVVDFGLARMSGEQTIAADSTQAGTLLGTPRYMSPEQARGESLDERTDIFSLGAVLYEMLSGHHAFSGAMAAEVFASLLSTTPPPPSRWSSEVPEALDEIVQRALERERKDRYRNMQELATDLQLFGQQSSKRKRNQRNPLSIWLRPSHFTVGMLVATLIGAFAWYAVKSRFFSASEPPSSSVVPLTSFAGFKDFGSLSPDGSRIAFSWNGGDGAIGEKFERSIYTKAIGVDEPVRLTFTAQDDRLPVWSPDGRSIAFCRALTQVPDASRYAIYVIPASGGKEQKVTEGGIGVSWSPDGQSLALADSPTETGGITLLSLKTHERRRITTPHSYADNLPAFSPDGRWIAFTRDFGFSAREIYIASSAGGSEKRLTFDREPTYGEAWTTDSREIVFASNRGIGGESLWRVPAPGGSPRRVSATLEGGFYPSISREGRRLVYTQASEDTNIDAYETIGPENGKMGRKFGPVKGLIMSSRRDDSPSISPDGERIAFVSKRTGNEEIWVCDRNGHHLKQLTSFQGPGTGTPRWSPDGHLIAFDSLAAGNPDIYVINAAGGKPRRITVGPSGNFMPSWSPDGKWIYFKSNRLDGEQIWKIPVEGRSPLQVTHGGASEGLASPDGKLLYFTRKAWGAIWTVPVNGGAETLLPELARYDKIFRSWGIIDRGIYFLSRQDDTHQTVRFFDFSTRRVTPLVTVDKVPVWDYPDLALSRDSHLLLLACVDGKINDLMLIENFH